MSQKYIKLNESELLTELEGITAKAYYGTVILQFKNIAKRMAKTGYHVRNASSANLTRYTVHWFDLSGNYCASDPITVARKNYLIDYLEGRLEMDPNTLENLCHNGYNSLQAIKQIKQGKEVDEWLNNKMQKTSVSHAVCDLTGKAGHLARVYLRR